MKAFLNLNYKSIRVTSARILHILVPVDAISHRLVTRRQHNPSQKRSVVLKAQEHFPVVSKAQVINTRLL